MFWIKSLNGTFETIKIDILDQITSIQSEFIQNMSQAPSKCLKKRIKADELDYFKNAS